MVEVRVEEVNGVNVDDLERVIRRRTIIDLVDGCQM